MVGRGDKYRCYLLKDMTAANETSILIQRGPTVYHCNGGLAESKSIDFTKKLNTIVYFLK